MIAFHFHNCSSQFPNTVADKSEAHDYTACLSKKPKNTSTNTWFAQASPPKVLEQLKGGKKDYGSFQLSLPDIFMWINVLNN